MMRLRDIAGGLESGLKKPTRLRMVKRDEQEGEIVYDLVQGNKLVRRYIQEQTLMLSRAPLTELARRATLAENILTEEPNHE